MNNEPPTPRSAGTCAGCGRPLPRNAPAGLCPACLFGQGIRLATAQPAQSGGFAPPPLDDLRLLFPEFEFIRLLGRGGMGAVYHARQHGLDRPVALKILPPEVAGDPEFSERFRREAATLARLDHSGIVQVFDCGQREGFAYFVMELVNGSDLAYRITQGPVPAPEVRSLLQQLCDALQHSHDQGIVHRDIKPANLLLTAEGRIKVVDFGLARLVHPEASQWGLTRTHATLGTPRYMAPEQMTPGRAVDHRADIYALGVVLYELLTGHVPAGHFAPPSRQAPTLNPNLDAVVLRALSPEPERRYGSASELARAFGQALDRPALSHQARRRQLLIRVFAVSLGAALVGFAATRLWLNGPGKPPEASNGQMPAAPAILETTAGRLVVVGALASPPFATTAPPIQSVAVAAAREEVGLALGRDGLVRAWGGNRFGQIEVPADLRSVVAIAAGQGPRSAHALALRADGTLVGWGDNTFQQARPPDGLGPVVAITAGEWFSLAVQADGRVVGWGHQASGAATVPDGLPSVKALAAGADFSVALLTEGTLVAWGNNERGQCNIPASVTALEQIAAGWRHGLARRQDGKVIAWGDNAVGQCQVPSDLPPAVAIFAGGEGSAALDHAGRFHAWGKVPDGVKTFSGRVLDVAIGNESWILLTVREPLSDAK